VSPPRLLLASLPALVACTSTDTPSICGGDAPLSTCLSPTQSDAWYLDQADRYFDTLDGSAPRDSVPSYAEGVARWEWPPWLLLTGYGSEQIAAADAAVLALSPTTTVPQRDCRAFDVQPFARCRVSLDYDGAGCPIYEEFTFNDQGELSFVEAWSDLPGLRATEDPSDPWAEGSAVHRLSWRVPGLGRPDGRIDPNGPAMTAAAATDPEIADFVARTQDFWGAWLEAYDAAGDDLFARGCGW